MAAPDPFYGDLGTPGLFNYQSWLERATNYHASGGGSHSVITGEEALVADVPFNQQYDAMRFFNGWSAVSTVAPYNLLRSLPAQHPLFEWMYCTGVSNQPWKLDSSNPGLSFWSGLKRIGATFGFFTGYNKSRLTTKYNALPYNVVSDSAIYGSDLMGGSPMYCEWLRFTSINLDPKLEALSLDGILAFAEGLGNTAPISNPGSSGPPDPTDMSPRDVQYQAPIVQLLVKPDIEFYWQQVPSDFVESPNFVPVKILAALGKVNLYPFYSWTGGSQYASPAPAGTLLFLGAHIERFTNPLRCPSRLTGYLASQGAIESKYYLNIKLIFSYFNPPKGVSNNGTFPLNTYLGHNCFPWAGGRNKNGYVLTGDTNAGKWFFATRSGNPATAATDPTLLEYTDFSQIFTNWQA